MMPTFVEAIKKNGILTTCSGYILKEPSPVVMLSLGFRRLHAASIIQKETGKRMTIPIAVKLFDRNDEKIKEIIKKHHARGQLRDNEIGGTFTGTWSKSSNEQAQGQLRRKQ